jgi:hypothetical protein
LIEGVRPIQDIKDGVLFDLKGLCVVEMVSRTQ